MSKHVCDATCAHTYSFCHACWTWVRASRHDNAECAANRAAIHANCAVCDEAARTTEKLNADTIDDFLEQGGRTTEETP